MWFLFFLIRNDKSKSAQKALVELEDKLEVKEKSTARAEAEKLYNSVERMDDRAKMLMFKRFHRN